MVGYADMENPVQTSTSRQSETGTQSSTTVTAVVWPDYGPTLGLSKWFRGHKERGSEKKDWLVCTGVRDSSMLVALNAPSKAHEDGGPKQR
ncbi:hypothetical protein Taro_037364 [Colocasia esculenta]|uniref:Uncharacterized protein n=1 Tax=Colocasia esculenta TaxID=4460 RepID=A0A843W5H8_COLES|nr:hypothetical protein [Colocasia esculenta]